MSPNFVVLPVDGAILKATREIGNLTFFVEEMMPEMRENKTNPNKITSELRLELRMPLSALAALMLQISEALKTLKDDRMGVVYLAPNAMDTTAMSITTGFDLQAEVERKRTEQ